MRRRNHLSPISRVPFLAEDGGNQIIKLDMLTRLIDIFRLIPRQMPWKVGCIDNEGCTGEGGGGAGGAGGAGL